MESGWYDVKRIVVDNTKQVVEEELDSVTNI